MSPDVRCWAKLAARVSTCTFFLSHSYQRPGIFATPCGCGLVVLFTSRRPTMGRRDERSSVFFDCILTYVSCFLHTTAQLSHLVLHIVDQPFPLPASIRYFILLLSFVKLWLASICSFHVHSPVNMQCAINYVTLGRDAKYYDK